MAALSPSSRFLVVAVAITIVAKPLQSQSFHQAPAPLTNTQIAAKLRLDRFAQEATRGDFRWPGTVIGAIGLGVAGGIIGAAYCGNSENGPRSCTGTTVGFAAGGAAIGALVGHLLGWLIPR